MAGCRSWRSGPSGVGHHERWQLGCTTPTGLRRDLGGSARLRSPLSAVRSRHAGRAAAERPGIAGKRRDHAGGRQTRRRPRVDRTGGPTCGCTGAPSPGADRADRGRTAACPVPAGSCRARRRDLRPDARCRRVGRDDDTASSGHRGCRPIARRRPLAGDRQLAAALRRAVRQPRRLARPDRAGSRDLALVERASERVRDPHARAGGADTGAGRARVAPTSRTGRR